MATSGKFRSKAKQMTQKDLGDHDPVQCNHQLNGKFIHYKPLHAIEGKETVKYYDKDGTRELLVPNRNPNELPGILPQSEFNRLKKQAHVVTVQDKMTMFEEAERKKNDLLRESEKRKELLHKSLIRQKLTGDNKLSEAASEAKKRNFYLLQRSYELLQEQDDRVKLANGIILATKCRAIRNAQIAEKELIEKQLAEEERRLDMMMEQQRQKALAEEMHKQEDAEEKRMKYVGEVMQQMKENELEKLLEAERLEEESRMMNKVLIALQKEDEQKMIQKYEDQKKIREEFARVNETTERYKQMKREEERLADLRIKEFMRQKEKRDQDREQEMSMAKAAKERDITRMRQQQQKAQDYQAMVQEINAQRVSEEVERKWRENELMAAKKKKQMDEEMKEGRMRQIEDIRKAQALRLARDEQDFHKVAQIQQIEYEKEKEKRQKQREQNIKHRKELLKQINTKERDRIEKRFEKFEEGKAQRIEEEVKQKQVSIYLQQKMKKLRESNLPDNYVKDIERQLKLNKIL